MVRLKYTEKIWLFVGNSVFMLLLASFCPGGRTHDGGWEMEDRGSEVLHKYYVSLTEVNINTQKNTLDVSSKMFIDDLELELEKENGRKVTIISQDKNVGKLLSDYVQKNFRINVGGKLQKLEFVGFEVENDAVWCYSEVHVFKGKGTISIMNTLLYGNFPEQSNLMNVNLDGNSKSAKLTNPEKLAEFSF